MSLEMSAGGENKLVSLTTVTITDAVDICPMPATVAYALFIGVILHLRSAVNLHILQSCPLLLTVL